MNYDTDKLYGLLPAIYRLRDAEQQGALRELLSVIAREVGVVEENLEQLYDDQFIETCAEWVVPYIGDLVGCRALHSAAPVRFSSRAEVANTIAYRRRKGTAAILEQLARDVTGWNARAVEFFELLAATQYLNHIRLQRVQEPDLRQWEPLERLDTAFDTIAHTVDVRRIAVARGRHNIPNIGIFLWRLDPYPLTGVPAEKLMPEDPADRRYLFNPLGCASQLYTRPEAEDEITHLAEPRNVPAPISRRVLADHLADYYGVGRSIVVYLNGTPVPAGDVQVCDLSDIAGGKWAHAPSAGKVAIDPVLGRFAFVAAQRPRDVHVTYHSVFSMDMGGGEYEREATLSDAGSGRVTIEVRKGSAVDTLQKALVQWAEDPTRPTRIFIGDSEIYGGSLEIVVPPNGWLAIEAANGRRPCVRPVGPIVIDGPDEGEAGTVILNGLLIDGGIRPTGRLKLNVLHTTLVPGRVLRGHKPSSQPDLDSIWAEDSGAVLDVAIDHSIVGALRLPAGGHLQVADSIVDAPKVVSEPRYAIAADDEGDNPGPVTTLARTTVFGQVYVKELPLVTDCILVDTVVAVRKQSGCVRFSYLPLDSLVPRRYRCQPDTEIAERIRKLESGGPAGDAERAKIADEVRSWLVPAFSSKQYTDPDYCQLHVACPKPIVEGAEDEAEMGAFHDVYWPQREANLRMRLREYLRFGLEAGILYESQRPLTED